MVQTCPDADAAVQGCRLAQYEMALDLVRLPRELLESIALFLPAKFYFRLRNCCRFLHSSLDPFPVLCFSDFQEYCYSINSYNFNYPTPTLQFHLCKKDALKAFGWMASQAPLRPELATLIPVYLAVPKFNPGAHSNALIQAACSVGNAALVQELLRHPLVDPSDRGDLAVQLAVRGNHVEVVELLLRDPRVDPGAEDGCLLATACALGHVELCRLFLAVIDPRVVEDTDLLLAAVESGSVDIVRMLMNDDRMGSCLDRDQLADAAQQHPAPVRDGLLAALR
ncbi:hypothetical protein HDV03_005134 [Kappamyces sp. JEL0829]|nr:hypothetical protein HDV03_005134 [Kappamyces sp. JEL0829]